MGALSGIRIVEIGGLGPAPFAAMMLADHGADVLRIERPDQAPLVAGAADPSLARFDYMARNRNTAAVDLKHPDGLALLHELAAGADVLLEGFRPGVAERLGFGPAELCAANPRLVYGRMTGWGQDGPMAQRAGHDINYIARSGALAHIGRAGQPPTAPLNLVGDFGGGGMFLAFGVCAALVERSVSGRGQVVDAAMVDGAALLMTPLFGAHASGFWSDERGTNLLDSGAPFYDCYQCADGGWMSVGAIEAKFFAELMDGLGIGEHPDQNDQSLWPQLRQQIATAFASQPRAVWEAVFDGRDACVAPVLTMGEAPSDAHAVQRDAFVEVSGAQHPAPAPRFSRTPADTPRPPEPIGFNTDGALASWGVDEARRAALRDSGAIR